MEMEMEIKAKAKAKATAEACLSSRWSLESQVWRMRHASTQDAMQSHRHASARRHLMTDKVESHHRSAIINWPASVSGQRPWLA